MALILLYYLYLGFLKAKDWILSTFEQLYDYFLSFFSVLQEVYDFVLTLPDQIADFFEDIMNDLIEGATDLFPF
jgi:hypothetical protein